jgi:uncharacterized protein
MKIPHANLLLYAVNKDAPLHSPAERWPETALSGDETVGFSWNGMRAIGTGGNLTSHAHLAALAVEHNADLCSCDNDFARFPGLDRRNPL